MIGPTLFWVQFQDQFFLVKMFWGIENFDPPDQFYLKKIIPHINFIRIIISVTDQPSQFQTNPLLMSNSRPTLSWVQSQINPLLGSIPDQPSPGLNPRPTLSWVQFQTNPLLGSIPDQPSSGLNPRPTLS